VRVRPVNGHDELLSRLCGPGWAAETPSKLFGAGQYYFGYGEAFGRTYDISRDGRRFLMIKDVALDQSSAPTILVVQGWFEELRRACRRNRRSVPRRERRP
jgi:hypothetical protein